MRTFAVTMTLLLALFVGGGYYAYELGVHPTEETETATNETNSNPEEGATAAGEATQEEGAAEAEETGEASADSRGDRTEGEGTVPQSNRINESTPSQNQASGRVNGAQSEINAASVDGNAERGKELYLGTCQGCHGTNAEGSLGPGLVGEGQAASWEFAQFAQVLYDGLKPDGGYLNATMPRFRRTSLQPTGKPATDQDLADIQAYLKTLAQ